MSKDFAWIKAETKVLGDDDFKTAKLPDNAQKNRYKNILANEVTLIDCGKYINANYVCCGRYISSQAPLPGTFSDFFDMCLKVKCNCIVMLTGLKEGGKLKADQYWNDRKELTFDKLIKVNTIKKINNDGCTVRVMNVTNLNTNESSKIVHAHYTLWPDFGCPQDLRPLFDFLYIAVLVSSNRQDNIPIAHCSAGVGRTGSFIVALRFIERYFEQHDNLPKKHIKGLLLCIITID